MLVRVRGTCDKRELAVTGEMKGKISHGRLLVQPNGLVMGKFFAPSWKVFLENMKEKHNWEYFWPNVSFSSEQTAELLHDTSEVCGYSEDF